MHSHFFLVELKFGSRKTFCKHLYWILTCFQVDKLNLLGFHNITHKVISPFDMFSSCKHRILDSLSWLHRLGNHNRLLLAFFEEIPFISKCSLSIKPHLQLLYLHNTQPFHLIMPQHVATCYSKKTLHWSKQIHIMFLILLLLASLLQSKSQQLVTSKFPSLPL